MCERWCYLVMSFFSVGVCLAKICFCFYWTSPQAYVLYSGYQIIENTCDIHNRLKSPPLTHPPLQSYSVSDHLNGGSLKEKVIKLCILKIPFKISFSLAKCRRVSATKLTFSSKNAKQNILEASQKHQSALKHCVGLPVCVWKPQSVWCRDPNEQRILALIHQMYFKI